MAAPTITLDVVRHVAKLAALSLTQEEQERMVRELGGILSFMAALDEVDVSNVPPTFHTIALQGTLRPDVVQSSWPREELLRAAPAHEAGGFAVPKVLDGEG
ncbi:MAG TPA: Asp-tRNA(Asn)/Glu-tRNA(Gln) amidotransferase subunit GatC [Polyangiales bacterium]|jgi:aspartyl-tRNA(Asn)/glutamyl-tRNA(Gln) amidotransferase subunit C|nr:Asp-tRNA(Asn)/Glu-tRNA(Gln) amidotransferase subunit GatC [Polyangiales bacterium]